MIKKISNKIIVLLQGCLLLISVAVAQSNDKKISPTLFSKISKSAVIYPASMLVSVTDENSFITWMTEKKIAYRNTPAKNTFLIQIKNKAAFNELLQCAFVVFINEYQSQPREELQISSLDLSTNKITLAHSKMPLFNGDGLVLSLKENLLDTTDIDFTGRYIRNPLASVTYSPHASIMGTMAAGAGNTGYLGKGAAPAASITSSDFSNLLPDANINYQQFNINVQNHSYGVGIENFYGADAAAFDASALQNNQLLFVFSSGNSGTGTATTGAYAGINGFANLTGSFKMAKNIITVGATDSFGVVAAASSKGPAYDGRLKPELVAFGQDGSSGAAALVSGTALLLQQAYKNNHGGNLPAAALIKAHLLNGADDAATEGIDYTSGYGSLNAYKALQGILNDHNFSGAVSNNASQSFSVTIPANISLAKFTLVWNDNAATVNAGKALVNDLDLELQSVSTGEIWQPWVLNHFPHKDSLLLLPVRKRDSLNVVEQVTLKNPVAGNYILKVKGYSVTGVPQPFSIAYQLDTANIFNWEFPSSLDNMMANASNILRWNSTLAATTGKIEYSVDNGSSWRLVDAAADLSKKYLRWTAPDTNAIAILKITAGAQSFLGDAFTISSMPVIKIGFNCPDSVLLFWNKNKGIAQYQLYALGTKYLQPVATISDTQFVFSKLQLPFTNFAIASKIGSTYGVKSTSINYSTQGVDCYVNNITADLVNTSALIQLTLGTTYLIKKISFEKSGPGGFVTLQEVNNITATSLSASDNNLIKGSNIYRVKIELLNGKIVYSNTVSVFYFNNAGAIIYPNPVLQYHSVTIQLNTFQASTLQIFTTMGEKVYDKKLSQFTTSFTAGFSKGLYLVKIILSETGETATYKLVVL